MYFLVTMICHITIQKNFILLLFKKFVWTHKFRGCQLDINRFKSYMNVNIVDLKFKFDIKGEGKKFSEWNAIFAALQG